jgi:hypothetical protein
MIHLVLSLEFHRDILLMIHFFPLARRPFQDVKRSDNLANVLLCWCAGVYPF